MSDIKKFLFDLNDFGEDAVEKQPVEEEPVIPTFSEEELEAAKAEAYNKGRIDGIDEERTSINQSILTLVEGLPAQIDLLLQAENIRNERFTNDSISLCLDALERAFPDIYNETHLTSLEKYLHDEISNNIEAPTLKIAIHPSLKEDIAKHLNALLENETIQGRIKISTDEAIEIGHAHIKWAHGGAIWSPLSLNQSILKIFKEQLPENYRIEHLELEDTASEQLPPSEAEEKQAYIPQDIDENIEETEATSSIDKLQDTSMETAQQQTPLDEAIKKEHNEDNNTPPDLPDMAEKSTETKDIES